MAKKRCRKPKDPTAERSQPVYRQKLPEELEVRLRTVWSKIGHLVDWCSDAAFWTKAFCSEARPYRETFYWEAVAKMVADYIWEHPMTSSERALTECLIATQSLPSADDSEMVSYFRQAWEGILGDSRKEIEAFIEADLDLATQEGNDDMVARLYAADYFKWEKGKEDKEDSA